MTGKPIDTQSTEQPQQHSTPSEPDDLYGIMPWRSRNGARVWVVHISRRGLRISRTFTHGIYGSEQEALAMAKAYRDAIVSLIPPAINRHLARTPQVRNKTGVPGIFPNVQWGKHPAWLAQLTSKHGIKRAWFRIDQYGGEDEARARAIAQREEWLRELPPEFKLSPGLSTETAEKYFGDLLDDSDEPEDEALIAAMIAEARKKLIEINARFDALRPRWLHLGLHLQTSQGQRLMLRVSDLAWKGKKHKVSLSLRRKPLAQGLAEMADNASGFIEELYGASVRDRFMSTHGSVFTVEGFDLERGVSIREIIERPAYAGVHPV